MKPYTRSIVDLFDGKKRYLVPLYQRQYAWRTSPDLELLWEDIERAVARINKDRTSLAPHFMGALVISQVKTFGKQVQAFEVIDGQQRLSTFQLLLTALRDVATANGSTYGEEIQKYLINDGVMETPEVERYKLWPSLTDRRAFVAQIDPSVDLDSIATKPLDEEGFVRRATAAYAFFRDRIQSHVLSSEGYEELRLERLFEALKEGLAAVSIELEGGDDPQTIFETLNSRGVDLSAGDLMRNFIFQRAKGLGISSGSLNVDKLYETHWLPLDRAFWQQLASRGRQTKPRLDWMLTDHLSMNLANLVSVDSLFENYRRWILNDGPFEDVASELAAISITASIERRLFEQNKSDVIGRFGIFAEAFDVSTAMPLVIYLATEPQILPQLSKALDMLESYILRRDICGYTTKNYNRFFVGIVDKLRKEEGDKLEALKAYLTSKTSEIDVWPNEDDFLRSWLGRDQYKAARQPRLRYIFELIEMRKRSALNEEIEIKSSLTIEHIMPQRWDLNWPVSSLTDADDEERDDEASLRTLARQQCINKLGNLTLLTQSLNTKVSNGPYHEKMPAVRAHSSLALNRELNDYDRWDEDTIVARGKSLFKIAKAIWAAPDPVLKDIGEDQP